MQLMSVFMCELEIADDSSETFRQLRALTMGMHCTVESDAGGMFLSRGSRGQR